MGLFDWAFNKVDVPQKKQKPGQPADLSMPAPTVQPAKDTPPEPLTERQIAASVLFDDVRPTAQTNSNNFSGAFEGVVLGNRNILIVTPRSAAETTGIVDHLRTGEAVIVNLDGLSATEAQRRVDFLSGVVCALGGTIKSIDAGKYILTPSGVGVKQ